MNRTLPLLAALAVLLSSCEKEITVDLPETEPKLVVEGTIEVGGPPIVILTRTQSYFAPTDLNSIAAIFVKGAVVVVSDGITTDTLDQVCSSQIPDSLIDEAAAATGLDPDLLASADICVYTDLGNQLIGVEGRTYSLYVAADDKVCTSVTSIPHAVALDSTWFRLAQDEPDDDTLGFIWATLSDPDTMGNAYRWYAKRINDGSDGEDKDDSFIAPFFSVFEDRYVNGLTFDFSYNRGDDPYAEEDEDDAENGYFKVGDTVVVRFASIGLKEYQFYNSWYNNVASQGDLFSNPANARSNVDGGLGVWAGYSYAYDTVVCQP
ncbi:MAG: DUF4249 domain-containing protein [Flavobacteriales bacterium]|nr:DUF4249 domain-containing protein [Flavobacteriales bacterium]